MTVEELNRFSKLTTLIVVFHTVWIALLLIGFGLLMVLEEMRAIVFVSLFPMAIICILFTVHIHRKLTRLDRESMSK